MRGIWLAREQSLIAAMILMVVAGPATAHQGVDATDQITVRTQQLILDRIQRELSEMEAARLAGDCKQMKKLHEDVDLELSLNRDLIPPALDDKLLTQLEAIAKRPCSPPPKPNAVESVLDDLAPVVTITDSGVADTVAPRPARPADGPAAPQRVEDIRGELEAARHREAERRRKAREQLKPDERTLLDLHNQARSQVGSPPLEWDPQLASQAASYGPTLARYERLVHSPRAGRRTSRENLLQALPGTSPQQMMNVWIAERRYFVPGAFPDVSSTGNWADVGHYTQMIWPATTAVGCAIQRGIGRFDWLICRYSPPGNQDGKRIEGRSPAASARP